MGTKKKWGRWFKCNLVIPSQFKKITRNSIPIDQGDRDPQKACNGCSCMAIVSSTVQPGKPGSRCDPYPYGICLLLRCPAPSNDAVSPEYRVSPVAAYVPMLLLLSFSVKLYLNQRPQFPSTVNSDCLERDSAVADSRSVRSLMFF